jgi:hypothetical protein
MAAIRIVDLVHIACPISAYNGLPGPHFPTDVHRIVKCSISKSSGHPAIGSPPSYSAKGVRFPIRDYPSSLKAQAWSAKITQCISSVATPVDDEFGIPLLSELSVSNARYACS